MTSHWRRLNARWTADILKIPPINQSFNQPLIDLIDWLVGWLNHTNLHRWANQLIYPGQAWLSRNLQQNYEVIRSSGQLWYFQYWERLWSAAVLNIENVCEYVIMPLLRVMTPEVSTRRLSGLVWLLLVSPLQNMCCQVLCELMTRKKSSGSNLRTLNVRSRSECPSAVDAVRKYSHFGVQMNGQMMPDHD